MNATDHFFRFWVIIFSLIMTSSCSISKKKDDFDEDHYGDSSSYTIDLNTPSEDVDKKDNGGSSIAKVVGSAVGPRPAKKGFWQKKVVSREPVVGVVLGPGLYRTFSYVGFFRAMEKGNVPINIVTGTELGLLMAALYAKDKKSSTMEWNLFKLIHELEDDDYVYSNVWKHKYKEFVDKIFKNDKIENLKLTLIIPTFESKRKKLSYHTKGAISPLLKSVINIGSNRLSEKYSSALFHELFPVAAVKSNGADIIIKIDSLGKSFNFIGKDSYLLRLYENVGKMAFKERKKMKLLYSLDGVSEKIDVLDNSQSLINFGEDKSYEFVKEIKKYIKKWKDDNVKRKLKNMNNRN